MNRRIIAALCLLLTLNACASYPSSVKPSYVSPTTYQHLNCDQVAEEHRRLQSETERVTQEQRSAANADTAVMTVGLVLFPLALVGLAFDTDRSDELARLKGELQASEEASAQCQRVAAVAPASAPAPAPVAAPRHVPTAAIAPTAGSRPALPNIPQGMCRMGGQYVPC